MGSYLDKKSIILQKTPVVELSTNVQGDVSKEKKKSLPGDIEEEISIHESNESNQKSWDTVSSEELSE